MNRVQAVNYRVKNRGAEFHYMGPDPDIYKCICSETLTCIDPVCLFTSKPMKE